MQHSPLIWLGDWRSRGHLLGKMDCGSPALPNSGQCGQGILYFHLVGRRLTFQLLSGLAGIGWSCWERLWIRRSWVVLHTLNVNLTLPPSILHEPLGITKAEKLRLTFSGTPTCPAMLALLFTSPVLAQMRKLRLERPKVSQGVVGWSLFPSSCHRPLLHD